MINSLDNYTIAIKIVLLLGDLKQCFVNISNECVTENEKYSNIYIYIYT